MLKKTLVATIQDSVLSMPESAVILIPAKKLPRLKQNLLVHVVSISLMMEGAVSVQTSQQKKIV
jgi:hypothetical protein